MLLTPVPHKEASEFIKDKPAVAKSVFSRLLPELRARAFTVSGVECASTLQDIRDRIADLPLGGNWDKIKSDIAQNISPWLAEPTGDPVEDAATEAAANRRAELLIRLHGFQAYSASAYGVMDRQRDVFPYWMYRSMGDTKVRDSHRALNGKIFPAGSTFWGRHYPPWEWGCRCQTIPLMDSDVAEIRDAEKDKPLEDRRVMAGEALKQVEEHGRLVSGINKVFDLRTPIEKGKPGGFEWSPADLRLTPAMLKPRYDAPIWQAFTAWARATQIPDGPTVAEWIGCAKTPEFSSFEDASAFFALHGVSRVVADAPPSPYDWGTPMPEPQALRHLEKLAAETERMAIAFPRFRSGLHTLIATDSETGLGHLDGGEPWIATKAKEWAGVVLTDRAAWEQTNARPWISERQGSQVEDNFRHEIGHTIATPQVIAPWDQLVSAQGGLEWFRHHVSEYSAKNSWEALSETFGIMTRADYTRGSLPKPLEDFIFQTILKK